MPSLKRIEMPSVRHEAQERIKQYIVESKLQPGAALLSEAQLCEQLGVSRTVVREALRALESAGLIYTRRGAGRYVSSFSVDSVVQTLGYTLHLNLEDLQDILEVRKYLEAGSIGLAIANMDGATLEQLRGLVATMKAKAARREFYLLEDLEFHRQLFAVVGNRFLMKLLMVAWEMYRYVNEDPRYVLPNQAWMAAVHENILNAVEGRDLALSQRLIVEHIGFVQARFRKRDGDAASGQMDLPADQSAS